MRVRAGGDGQQIEHGVTVPTQQRHPVRVTADFGHRRTTASSRGNSPSRIGVSSSAVPTASRPPGSGEGLEAVHHSSTRRPN